MLEQEVLLRQQMVVNAHTGSVTGVATTEKKEQEKRERKVVVIPFHFSFILA